jgi:uncharacterized membrane protein
MTEVPMSSALGAEGGVRIGYIFSRAFAVLSRHFVSFALLAAIPVVPATLFGRLASSPSLAESMRVGATHISAGTVLSLFVGFFLWFLLAMIAQAMILYGSFQDMRGKPVDVVESAKRGLARALPIVGVSICVGFMAVLGAALLVVPAFIFFSMYYVALPACVVEKLGPFESMSRSAALTKGHRWKVFGLYMVIGVVGFIANIVITRVFGLFGSTILLLASLIWASLIGAYRSITVAVLYHDLRAAREGIDIEQMVAVFD